MDAKVTLSFDKDVIKKAKKFAEKHHISLSRLTEYLLNKASDNNVQLLTQLPIADWIIELSDGKPEYHVKSRSRKAMKSEYFESRR